MNRLGVQHGSGSGISKPPAKGKARSKGVRVVYIASPMKLMASPEEFRAIVQELTGRHSNVADRDDYVDRDASMLVRQSPSPPTACAYDASWAAPTGTGAVVTPPPVLTPLPPQLQSYGEHEAASPCYGQGYYC